MRFHHVNHTSLLLRGIEFLPSLFEFTLKKLISLFLFDFGIVNFQVIALPFLDDVFSEGSSLFLAQDLFSERLAVFAPSLLGVFGENVANILLIIVVVGSWTVILNKEIK